MELCSATLDEDFTIVSELGSGTYGNVLLAERNGQLFAIKMHKPKHADVQKIRKEFEIMKTLDHPNIAKAYQLREEAVIRDSDGMEIQCFVTIMQYIKGADLHELLTATRNFSPQAARTLFNSLITALSYMHKRGIAHRDIKPQNILVDRNFNLKIVDFGWSTYTKDGRAKTKAGTNSFIAPQVRSKNYDAKQADLFSAGVVLFYVYSGGPPFYRAYLKDQYYECIIYENYDEFWRNHCLYRPNGFYTEEFKTLINKMLCVKPGDRYTMEQVRNHVWTKGKCYDIDIMKKQIHQRLKKVHNKKNKQQQSNELYQNSKEQIDNDDDEEEEI